MFTWETNVSQKYLPNKNKLNLFLNKTCGFAAFQLECGEKAKKMHYQGGFTLTGVRQSKIGLLKIFQEDFKNTSGLTLQKVHDKEAVIKYVTKEETRIEGPFYCGKKEKFDLKMSTMSLRNWQLEFFNYLKSKLNNKEFRGRKIIWLEDLVGNTGKSTLLKWLRVGQSLVVPSALISLLLTRSVLQQIFNQREYFKFKELVNKMLQEDEEVKKIVQPFFMEGEVPTTNVIEMQPRYLDKNHLPEFNFDSDQTFEKFIKAKMNKELRLVESPTPLELEEIIKNRKIINKRKTVY